MLRNLTDDEFLAPFESGRLHEFRHRDHLRLAWLELRRHGRERGGDLVAAGIRRFSAARGQADRYHETITRF
jgi:N-formylglutamate deformylase